MARGTPGLLHSRTGIACDCAAALEATAPEECHRVEPQHITARRVLGPMFVLSGLWGRIGTSLDRPVLVCVGRSWGAALELCQRAKPLP